VPPVGLDSSPQSVFHQPADPHSGARLNCRPPRHYSALMRRLPEYGAPDKGPGSDRRVIRPFQGWASGLRCKPTTRCSVPRHRSRARRLVGTVACSGRLENPRFGRLSSFSAAEADSAGPLVLAHARKAPERRETLFGPLDPALLQESPPR
jgi:hypothetical protein